MSGSALVTAPPRDGIVSRTNTEQLPAYERIALTVSRGRLLLN